MKLITTLLTLALTTVAQAELMPKHFGQMKDWAEREGYSYQGIGRSNGVNVFMFEKPSSVAFAPLSSDTPDEAINALIGSAALYHQAVITATKLNRGAQEKAYKEGFKDGAKYGGAEDAYRRGYIDGSQLRGASAEE
jgi:hypothetical protein